MAEEAKILLVDDEPEILEMLDTLLKSEGYAVRCAQNGDDAIRLFKEDGAHVVVTDLRMPGMDGLEVLRIIKSLDSSVEVIVLTGHASIDTAISALKSDGAYDFLTKPLEYLDDFVMTIEKALTNRRLILENTLLLEELSRHQINLESQNKELRQTKHALEISRHRYQDLYDQAPVGYLTIDPGGQITEINQTAANLFELSKSNMLLKNISDVIFEEDLAAFRSTPYKLGGGIPHAIEIRMTRSDGQPFHAHLERLAILKQDGSIDQVRITINDITAQKQMEITLKESEQRYRSFVESFKGIAFMLGADGTPVFYHGAVETTTGYCESDFIRSRPSWAALVHAEDQEKVQSVRRALCVSKDRNTTHEYRIRHKNRQWRWVREHIQCLNDPEETATVLHGIVFDITDHKRLQAQYMESRKLDAIVTMAAGIAHQYNNSLSGLMGNLELLELNNAQGDEIQKYTHRMMGMIRGMAQLTRQLLAYARGGKYMPSKLSTHDLVHQSINLIDHRLSKKYALNMALSADRDHIHADSTQMQMVVLAVMENAIEAMPDGGQISVRTQCIEMEKETIKGGGKYQSGPYLCLAVKDNGSGMPNHIAEKVFDPFFTTKFIGRGLGLSAAYGIVANHGGWMDVETEEKKGTEIRIYLPLTQSPGVRSTPPGKAPLPKGDATIMVVEDEEMVMQALHDLLERLEYRVIEALNGRTAIDVLKNFRGQIDVVLLDVKLPDVEAIDLYEQMLQLRPELKVIVCSGYNQDGPVEQLIASGANAFLQKPFSISKLSTELKSALEGDPPPGDPNDVGVKIF